MGSGRIERPIAGGLKLFADWSSVSNVISNSSNVNINAYLYHQDLQISKRVYSVTVDGQTQQINANSIYQTSTAKTNTSLGSLSFANILHDSNGSKIVNINISVNLNITYSGKHIGVVTLATAVALDNIDQSTPNLSLSINNITTTTAQINASASHRSYSVSTFYFLNNSQIWSTSLTGLTPKTSYSVKVIATAANNKSTEQTVSFTTSNIPVTQIIAIGTTLDERGTATAAIFEPSNHTESITYTSSYPEVCTVSDNTIHGISKGISTVIIQSANITKTITATVLRRVTGITVDDDIQIQSGESFKLSWKVIPDTASDTSVIFTSSDETIATVSSDGIVSSVSVGTVIILLTTNDGTYNATVNIEVVGDVPWIMIEPKNYLPTYDINNVYNNFLFIRSALLAKGYSVGSITKPYTTDEYHTNISTIKDTINTVENDIDIINTAIDWDNEYYIESYRWIKLTIDKKQKVFRWLQWLNQCYSVITGITPKTYYLLDIGGNQIYDINGENILCYGHYF